MTMGSVDEPYLAGTPDLAVFASRLVFSGFTFGEAAYTAQSALSWQTTVIGDPLYRPFGRDAESLHTSLLSRKSPSVDWSFLRLVNLNLVAGRSAANCAAMLETFDRLKSSAVLTEKMADLNVAQGKPNSAIFEYQRALERAPSPMQRLRIRLLLADRLSEQNQPAEALRQLDAVLAEFPDYPRLDVLKRAIDLAQRLQDEGRVKVLKEEIQRLTPPPIAPPASTNQSSPPAPSPGR
jgi:tetratricopeptide (TPR) repeat protein